MVFGFDDILGGIGLGSQIIGGLFGGDDEETSYPQQVTQQTGFSALPPEIQKIYMEKYLSEVLAQHGRGQYQQPALRVDQGVPFQSQGLQDLQTFYDRLGMPNAVRPIGVEPLNDLQRSAYSQYQYGYNGPGINENISPYSAQALNAYSRLAGNPMANELGHQGIGNELGQYIGAIGGQQGQNGGIGSIQDYMNPRTQEVINRTIADIQEQLHGANNRTLSDAALTGAGTTSGNLAAFGGSALGTLLAQNQKNATKQGLDFAAQQHQQNYNQAQEQRNLEIQRALGQRSAETGLRNQYLQNLGQQGYANYGQGANIQNQQYNQRSQTLADMLKTGNSLQDQYQNQLNAATQYGQNFHNAPQANLTQLSGNLAPFAAGQNFQYGGAKPDFLSRVGQVGGLLGGIQQRDQNNSLAGLGSAVPSIGNSMPWLNNQAGGSPWQGQSLDNAMPWR